MGKLVQFLADGTPREIRLDRERITIGRRPDNDVCLPQPAVSGEHSVVVTILADSFLEDLGSTNGTLVNGKAVTRHFLRDRDEIDIGRQILVYLADESVKLAPRPPQIERPSPPASGPATDSASAGGPSVAAVANGAQHGKRRSDGPAESAERDPDAIQRFVAVEIERDTADAGDPGVLATPAEAAEPPSGAPGETVASVRVVSGACAGRILPLAKAETLVGRAGVQVAALQRTDDEIRLVPVEGEKPPTVNGLPIAADGQRVAAGDILEIAGAKLELVAPSIPGG